MPENCHTHNLVEYAVEYASTFTTYDACLMSLREQKLYGLIKSIQYAHNDYFFLTSL